MKNIEHIGVAMYLCIISFLVSFSDEKPREFTINEPLQYYYQDPNIPITAIRWGIGPVDEEESDREFYNPVNVSDVFNKFGSGAFQLSCFYRQSSPTDVGSFLLNMRGNYSVDNFFEKCDT